MDKITIRPALSSGRREALMAAGGRVQLAVTDDRGLVRYVKIEAKARVNGRFAPAPLEDATHVFVSEKGYGSPRVGTYYPPKPGYSDGRFFEGDNASEAHVEAFEAAVAWINGEDLPFPFDGIKAESKCGLCGQPLRDPVSVERGIGPDCIDSPTGTRVLSAYIVAKGQQAAPAAPAPVVPIVSPRVLHALANSPQRPIAAPTPARVERVAPNRLMRAMDVMDDAELEAIAAEAKRILAARIEAALAGTR